MNAAGEAAARWRDRGAAEATNGWAVRSVPRVRYECPRSCECSHIFQYLRC